jgi:hypothetical protein
MRQGADRNENVTDHSLLAVLRASGRDPARTALTLASVMPGVAVAAALEPAGEAAGAALHPARDASGLNPIEVGCTTSDWTGAPISY